MRNAKEAEGQLGLFGHGPKTTTGLLFQRHSPTSEGAAAAIESSAASMRGQVLRAIQASTDGLTDEQIQVGLGMNPSTERPRRIELVAVGLAVDSGRTRATKSGRQAVIWIEKKA